MPMYIPPKEETLITEGYHEAIVSSAEDGVSKAGNPYLKVMFYIRTKGEKQNILAFYPYIPAEWAERKLFMLAKAVEVEAVRDTRKGGVLTIDGNAAVGARVKILIRHKYDEYHKTEVPIVKGVYPMSAQRVLAQR